MHFLISKCAETIFSKFGEKTTSRKLQLFYVGAGLYLASERLIDFLQKIKTTLQVGLLYKTVLIK